MNKDALLATLIGFAVGLVITSIVIFAPTVTKNLPKISFPKISFTKPTVPVTPVVNTVQNTKHSLTIDSPLPESVEQTEKILISGTTTPQSTILISTTEEDTVTIALDDGKYAGKVTLTEGKNTVTVTSITKEKEEARQTSIVYYTPEEW